MSSTEKSFRAGSKVSRGMSNALSSWNLSRSCDASKISRAGTMFVDACVCECGAYHIRINLRQVCNNCSDGFLRYDARRPGVGVKMLRETRSGEKMQG